MSNVLEQFRLDGKVALVTGGSKGLGFAMAQALAEAGAQVALCSRNGAESEEAARQIAEAAGRKVLGFQADVIEPDSVAQLARDCEQAFGKVDILVANAGINIRKPFTELTVADWDAVVDISAKGSFLCARAFLPAMMQRGWGRIVLLGSTMAFVSMPHRAAYSTSKAALVGLTHALALEAAPHGVTVNCLCPGPFETPMNRVLKDDPKAYQAFLAKVPLGRWAQPEELGGVIVFLCSPASNFMTGTTLIFDGGWTAQ